MGRGRRALKYTLLGAAGMYGLGMFTMAQAVTQPPHLTLSMHGLQARAQYLTNPETGRECLVLPFPHLARQDFFNQYVIGICQMANGYVLTESRPPLSQDEVNSIIYEQTVDDDSDASMSPQRRLWSLALSMGNSLLPSLGRSWLESHRITTWTYAATVLPFCTANVPVRLHQELHQNEAKKESNEAAQPLGASKYKFPESPGTKLHAMSTSRIAALQDTLQILDDEARAGARDHASELFSSAKRSSSWWRRWIGGGGRNAKLSVDEEKKVQELAKKIVSPPIVVVWRANQAEGVLRVLQEAGYKRQEHDATDQFFEPHLVMSLGEFFVLLNSSMLSVATMYKSPL